MRNQSILSGVPFIESPFFNEIAASEYFNEHESQIATDLNLYGFAVLPGFFVNISNQAQQIKADLLPIFDDCKSTGDKVVKGIQASRIQDAFKFSESVKSIACDPRMLTLLKKLYGREAFAFQTLNFEQGSQQAAHSDAVHFHSSPERFMCGVWVALEDVSIDSGPLCYYPHSHKLPVYDCRQVGFTPDKDTNQTVYEPLWNKLIEANGLRKKVFIAKAGDALIWTANLLHGGEPILREGATRWSQVTHYYFADCDYYTPMHSDMISGVIAKRKPLDISKYLIDNKSQQSSGAKSQHNGKNAEPAVSSLTKTLRKLSAIFGVKKQSTPTFVEIELPEDFDTQAYAHLNPDIVEAGVDPALHYARHGYLEHRPYKIMIPEDFDEAGYLALNPDVAQAGIDPKRHFVLHGYRENRAFRQ